MTPEEYEERVRTDRVYAASSKRWDDHLAVYPDVDGSTRDNVGWLRGRAAEDEEKRAAVELELAEAELAEAEAEEARR